VAKPDSTQATEALHEIESIFDRMAHWVAHNPIAVLGLAGTLLAGAAGFGGFRAWRADREADASADVAAVQAEYLLAMGAQPGVPDLPEPANAEIAASTRREFAARFSEAAERRAGSTAAATARLQAGDLLEAVGDQPGAQAAWRAAAAETRPGSALQALALTKLAASLEGAGDPEAAAAEYLAAGQSEDFPGRILALGDAARCLADAGQTERALEVFARIEAEQIKLLPPHVAARLTELRVQQAQAAR
jgi:hypothetical protein